MPFCVEGIVQGGKDANIISDETIEYVGIWQSWNCLTEEKEKAKADMGKMLEYIE